MIISPKKRREARQAARTYFAEYATKRPKASEDEIKSYVEGRLQIEYGMSPAMMLVIAEIILEVVKAWREGRK